MTKANKSINVKADNICCIFFNACECYEEAGVRRDASLRSKETEFFSWWMSVQLVFKRKLDETSCQKHPSLFFTKSEIRTTTSSRGGTYTKRMLPKHKNSSRFCFNSLLNTRNDFFILHLIVFVNEKKFSKVLILHEEWLKSFSIFDQKVILFSSLTCRVITAQVLKPTFIFLHYFSSYSFITLFIKT